MFSILEILDLGINLPLKNLSLTKIFLNEFNI